MSNPVIGKWRCPMGGVASVSQSKKRGRYFNTNCECCGFQQGTKAERQNSIYHTAEFFDGAEVIKPANIRDDWKPKASEQQTEKAAEPIGEPVAEKVSEPEQSSPDLSLDDIEPEATETVESEPKLERKTGLLKILSILLLGGGFVGAIWASV